MAKLVKCKACGNDIAKSAKACPHCGAKHKRGCGCFSVGGVLLLVLLVLVVYMMGKAFGKASDRADEIRQEVAEREAAEEREKLAAMTPEEQQEYFKEKARQQLADQFASKFRSSWDGSIKPVVAYVKENMKNPASFEHVKTNWFIRTDAENQYIVRMRYRGTNSFGAVVTEDVEVIVGQNGEILTK